MLTCSLPICCKYAGDDTICAHKELPGLDSPCAKSFSAIQDLECPTSCTKMRHWLLHLPPATATRRETRSFCGAMCSIAPFATEKSRWWERVMSLVGKQKRNTKRQEGFRLIYTQSHVKWACVRTLLLYLRAADQSAARACFTPHVGEGINKWCCCRQFRLRLVEIQPKPALYFLQDP